MPCLILGLPFFHIKCFFILSSSRTTEFGITFTNARCTIFDIARVLNTVVLPASFVFSKTLNVFQFLKLD